MLLSAELRPLGDGNAGPHEGVFVIVENCLPSLLPAPSGDEFVIIDKKEPTPSGSDTVKFPIFGGGASGTSKPHF